MSSFVDKALNIEPGESKRVYLLLAQGFFMGIFLATYSVASTALFITRFDEGKDLPVAILASGVVGIIATWLYSYFQTKVTFSSLARGSLILVTILVVGTFFGIEFTEDNSQVIYAAFVFTIPFASISLLIFWGIFGRIFDLRQSKRIIGGIDTGQLIASIVALFGVGFIIDAGLVTSEGLYFFSGISAFLLVVIVFYISSSFKLVGASGSSDKAVDTRQYSFVKIAGNKYIRLMAAFVIISLVAAFFVDYSFLNVASIQFETEKELAGFIALFEATVVIFSFLFQTFVTDWIIANYGLKVSLLINPVLIGILTGLAFLIGITLGYSQGVEDFIYFFLIIAMSKLFIDSIKDALDGPAFKLYFLPIDPSVKFDIQTKIEGVVTAFAGVVAGGLIILINSVQLDLIFVTIFLAPIILIWFSTVRRMHGRYREALQNTLSENQGKKTQVSTEKYTIQESLQGDVSKLPEADVISTLKLMEKVEPGAFEESVKKLRSSGTDRIKDYAKIKSSELDLDFDLKTDSEAKQLAEEALGQIQITDKLSITADQLYNLTKSPKKDHRMLAAKLLRTNADDKNIFVLLELLRDIDSEVRMEAVLTARKVNRRETWSILVEMLDSTTFSHAAAAALVEGGDDVLEYMETAFHRSGQSEVSQLKIVQIYGKIGGAKAMDLLWKKIDYPDRKIVRQILITFGELNFKANQAQAIKLNEMVEDEIGKAIWNLAALNEIEYKEQNKYLIEALKKEVDSNYDFIYMLLSLIYDPQSIQLVRENLESESADGIAYAMELLDIFLFKELKPKLFPLIDDIDTDEKLRRLQVFYPREEYEEHKTLNYILNRDYNNINKWTKACAIEAIYKSKDFKVTKGLVAHLFNPDSFLRETAARVLFEADRNVYETVSRRLSEDKKRELDNLLYKQEAVDFIEDPYRFRIEKTKFLLSLPEFSGLLPVIVSQLVDKIDVKRIKRDSTVTFDLNDNNKPIGIVARGSLQVRKNGDPLFTVEKGDIFGEIFIMDSNHRITEWHAYDDCVIYQLDVNQFFTIVSNHPKLAQQFITTIGKKFDKILRKI